jgi:cytochrome P450
MISQMATLILAGHVTTANTLSWMLYELAKHQEYQSKMREEIAGTRARLRTDDFTIDDLENMPFVVGCLKVGPGAFICIVNH